MFILVPMRCAFSFQLRVDSASIFSLCSEHIDCQVAFDRSPGGRLRVFCAFLLQHEHLRGKDPIGNL